MGRRNHLFHLFPRVLLQPMSYISNDCDVEHIVIIIFWHKSFPSSRNPRNYGMYASIASISGHVTFSIPATIITGFLAD